MGQILSGFIADLARQGARAEAVVNDVKKEVPSCKVLFMDHDVTKEPEWERVIAESVSTRRGRFFRVLT